MTLMRYDTSLQERGLLDRARLAVVRMGLHSSIKTYSRRRKGVYAPRVDDETLSRLHCSLFLDAERPADNASADIPDREDFVKWFRNERTLGDRYTFIADELGEGVLFHLLPHFTDANLVRGTSKKRKICVQGLDHVHSLGICEDVSVIALNENIRRLKQHLNAHFDELFKHIGRVESESRSTKKRGLEDCLNVGAPSKKGKDRL